MGNEDSFLVRVVAGSESPSLLRFLVDHQACDYCSELIAEQPEASAKFDLSFGNHRRKEYSLVDSAASLVDPCSARSSDLSVASFRND